MWPGIINFGSLYFLLETYDKINLARSGVMPVNNLGVILRALLPQVLFLGERSTGATMRTLGPVILLCCGILQG